MGELQVYKHSFLYPRRKSFFIAENSEADRYASGRPPLKFKNEEIAMIRKALQEITRHRITNPTDVEDLVQETLLTMLTKHPGAEPEKGLLVWCQGILRNKVGNYYRRNQRQVALRERHSGDAARSTGSVPSPETTVTDKELRRIVSEKLAEFPPDIRRVMELLISGLDAGEIADQLYPERYQNVINRLYRGRKKLARELIKCGFAPGSGKRKNSRERRNESGIRSCGRIA
jgi:RNA polymerase sigma factor (sigma-70 family)